MGDATGILSAIASRYGLTPNALTDRSTRRATRQMTNAIAAATIALTDAGYSQRHIARLLHRGKGTIQHHIHNARFDVQTVLEDYRRNHE